MAEINLILLPPILNTVKLSTLSALGNMFLNSEKFDISVCLTIRYHVSKGVVAYGCLLENAKNFLRVIMCITKIISHNEIYYKQRISRRGAAGHALRCDCPANVFRK